MEVNLKSLRRALQIECLRLRISSYSRQLSSIQSQRDNDFQAECLIHRAMTLARSELNRLKLPTLAAPTSFSAESSKRSYTAVLRPTVTNANIFYVGRDRMRLPSGSAQGKSEN